MNMQTERISPTLILHLEDSTPDHDLVKRELRKNSTDVEIRRVDTLADFATELKNNSYDCILADYRLQGFTALDAWEIMKQNEWRVPVVLFSGAIGESAAVSAIKLGIDDFVHKDELHKLWRVVNRAIEMHSIQLEKEKSEHELAASKNRLAHFAEHLQSTIESERASIAREIHDDIGGSLAAIRFDLSWLSRHIPEPRARAHLSSANDMLTHAITASQRIMMNLRPAVLDEGLIAAVHWLADNFSRRTGILTVIQSPPSIDTLTKSGQLTAYRIAQEALTNISKYAKCHKVTIDISDQQGLFTLEVSDDGIGLAEGDLDKPSSYGLRGMMERARTVGGWVDVSSTANKGVSIVLSIPPINSQTDHNLDLNHDSSDPV